MRDLDVAAAVKILSKRADISDLV